MKKKIYIIILSLIIALSLITYGVIKLVASHPSSKNNIPLFNNNNNLRGEIVTFTDNQLTLKLNNNLNQLVLITPQTQINKLEPGFLNDLVIGSEVNINGQLNSDGSVTAQLIYLGPMSLKNAGFINLENRPQESGDRNAPSFSNLSQEERQRIREQLSRRTGSRTAPISGKIIKKDNESITIELQNGGSKIIFLSSATQIMKVTEGQPTDLEVGKTITVVGQKDSDNNFRAEIIQINFTRSNEPRQIDNSR